MVRRFAHKTLNAEPIMCADKHDMTKLHARAAVSAVFALSGSLFGVWASRIPAVADVYALSHAALGTVLLCLAAGAVVAFPFAGRAMDRHGAATVSRSLAAILPLTLLLIPLMPNPVMLAFALFLFGANSGAIDVAMNGWGAEVERKFDTPMMSSFHAMFSIGAGLGAGTGYFAAGTPIFQHFALAAIPLCVATLLVARGHWPMRMNSSTDAPLFALPKGVLALAGIMAMCSALGEGAMLDWGAIFLRDVLAAEERIAALGFTVFSIAMVTVRLTADLVVRRFGPVLVGRVCGTVAVVGALMLVMASSITMAMCGLALLGAGLAVQFPLAFSRAANDPDVPPGRALASVATLAYGGILLGPPVIGFLAEALGLQPAMWVLVVLSAAMIFLSSSLRK